MKSRAFPGYLVPSNPESEDLNGPDICHRPASPGVYVTDIWSVLLSVPISGQVFLHRIVLRTESICPSQGFCVQLHWHCLPQ